MHKAPRTREALPKWKQPLWEGHMAKRVLVTNIQMLMLCSNIGKFISIIYLHCTTLLKSTLQVHSTLQYIYFKNILLYKRFIEHWHVNLGWNSKHVTNSAVARMLPTIVNYTITSHHFSFKYIFLNKKWILQWKVPARILIS